MRPELRPAAATTADRSPIALPWYRETTTTFEWRSLFATFGGRPGRSCSLGFGAGRGVVGFDVGLVGAGGVTTAAVSPPPPIRGRATRKRPARRIAAPITAR